MNVLPTQFDESKFRGNKKNYLVRLAISNFEGKSGHSRGESLSAEDSKDEQVLLHRRNLYYNNFTQLFFFFLIFRNSN